MNTRRPFASLFPYVFFGAALLYAQNARIEALGGNFILDDISMMSGAPASGNYYGDIIQATAFSDSMAGSVYAVKSFGGLLSAGIIANQDSYLLSDFYSDARLSLDSTLSLIDTLPIKFGTYPHLVLATEIGDFGIGCELFFERSSNSRSWTSASGAKESQKAEIRNTGAAVSAAMQLWRLGIYPYAWFNFPSARGSAVVNDTSRDVKSSLPGKALYGAGIESSIDLETVYFRFGGYYTNEHYQLFTTRGAAESMEDCLMTSTGVYGGCTAYPIDALLLSVAYSYERPLYDYFFPGATAGSGFSNHYAESVHFLVGSCEYTISTLKVLDFIKFRGGLNWTFVRATYSETEAYPGAVFTAHIEYPDESSPVEPTFGIGLGRKGIHFDIASSLGGWFGLLAGPPILTGTITLHLDEMRKTSHRP
jgi:hypothetical protein